MGVSQQGPFSTFSVTGLGFVCDMLSYRLIDCAVRQNFEPASQINRLYHIRIFWRKISVSKRMKIKNF
jgi:hypothetical protein